MSTPAASIRAKTSRGSCTSAASTGSASRRAMSPRVASGRAVARRPAGTMPRTSERATTPSSRGVAATMPRPGTAGRMRRASATVASGGRTSGVSHAAGCALTHDTASTRSPRAMSWGSTPRPPRRARVAASRVPVTEFMFADTNGMVAPLPSAGARSTSRRLRTSEWRGTRKTSEYVRSTSGCAPENSMASTSPHQGEGKTRRTSRFLG